jgi:hypothetical protein
VIVVAVVNLGVTPLPAAIVGDTAPDQSIALVPPPDLPVLKKLMVPEPPVPATKSMFAAGLTLPALDVVQPVERATLARAYDVYVVSLDDCVPLSVGSAVCNATTIFVSGDAVAFTA